MVEMVPGYAASALAAMGVFWSVGGSVFPLATSPLYDSVGFGWGGTVMSAMCIVMTLVPLALYLHLRRGGPQSRFEICLEDSEATKVHVHGPRRGSVGSTSPQVSSQSQERQLSRCPESYRTIEVGKEQRSPPC